MNEFLERFEINISFLLHFNKYVLYLNVFILSYTIFLCVVFTTWYIVNWAIHTGTYGEIIKIKNIIILINISDELLVELIALVKKITELADNSCCITISNVVIKPYLLNMACNKIN